MPTVTINGNEYNCYIDLADADVYLGAQLSATTWATATDDQKGMALVTMTRILNRQVWQGEPASPESAEWMAWPRSGLEYRDGTAVPDDAVPLEIIDATCEGASYILNGSNLQDVPDTFNPNKIIKAGSVMIESFRLIEPLPRFPQAVQELVSFWLGGPGTLIGAESAGTCGRSIMGERYDVNEGF